MTRKRWIVGSLPMALAFVMIASVYTSGCGSVTNTPSDGDSTDAASGRDGGAVAPGEIAWVRSLGDIGPYSVAYRQSGSVFIAGATNVAVDLGGGTLTPFGDYDMVLAELSTSDAAHRWSTSFGDIGGEFATVSAFDDTGVPVVHGVSYGTVNLGAGTVVGAGGADGFVGRYPIGKSPTWIQRIAAADEDKFQWAAAAAGGSLFVSGYFTGMVELGSQVLVGNGGRDVLLVRFAGSDGQVLLAQSWGGPGLDEGNSVAWTGAEVIIAGRFEQSVSFGDSNDTLTSAGGRDVFVAKLRSDGALVWSASFGGTGDEGEPKVQVDGDGNIYLYSSFEGEVAFGAVNLTSAGGADLFITKLDPSGNVLWARAIGGSGVETASTLAVAPDGQVAITGRTTGDIDLGAGVVANVGGLDSFVASYNTLSGEHQWATMAASDGDDYGWGVSFGDDGFVYATLTTSSPTVWNPPPIGPMPDPTAVLLKIAR